MKRIIFTVLVLSAFLSTTLQAQSCMSSGGDLIGVSGFIQPQYNYFLNGNDINGNNLDKSNFTFNRARLGVMGEIPYDIEYYMVVEFSSFKTPEMAPHLLDAFVSYTRFGQWAKISMGQFKSPFSLEQNTSCSGLYTINRSEVVNQLAGPQRDLGLLISGGHDSIKIEYSLGFMNGTGMNVVDNNRNKHLVGRVVLHPLAGLQIGGSFNLGKLNPTDPTQRMNDIYRFGGEIQYKSGGLLIQSEYIHGIDQLHTPSTLPVYGGCGGIVDYVFKPAGSHAKSGFWAMAAYMTSWNIEPVVKFDSYNSDHGTVGKRTNYTTIGLNYYVNDYSRVQINYVNVAEASAVMNDMIMVQLQAKF